ncbi:MAG TPA: calcium-binding protein [Oscillatoriales cyanobacterium M59_W2019_021]|nr:MAG: calcium-binding protein [Cyanobacteria bacterium J055]HIK34066.1 calcium-binding protein [Oscillatoriales cyanobacterium M4454_W2019_049]HIK50703.1 calcium-binding protein [Oscillatoriales cyanobacterium M59_W2019_021]
MQILTGPIPTAIPGVVYDLSNDPATPDDVQLTPGLLATYPFGMRALDGNDTVMGSADSELIFGNIGEDRLEGSGGNDSLLGGRDNDVINGHEEDDLLAGNIGNDIVDGGAGNDSLFGGQNNDALVGGEGNDTMSGDFGVDALIGGVGADVFVLRADNTSSLAEFSIGGGNADVLIDFNGAEDRIALTGGLTEASLITLELNNQPLQITPEVQGLIDAGILPLTAIDPDGDGLVNGTLIGINGTGQFLGVALNVTPIDLQGKFISI